MTGTTYEDALRKSALTPWNLSLTGFTTPPSAVPGWDGTTELAPLAYPRTRRPSGGLWSSVPELLTAGEGLLADRALLEEIRRLRTRADDPMTYGLGWAVGPSGQLYLNGRLPGYRAAMVLIPDEAYVSVAVVNEQNTLPALATLLSAMQQPLTGDDIAGPVNEFAA